MAVIACRILAMRLRGEGIRTGDLLFCSKKCKNYTLGMHAFPFGEEHLWSQYPTSSP